MRPVLIIGTGTLGHAFARLCDERGLARRLLGRRDLDLAEPDAADRAVRACQPWLVVNAAGYSKVDHAESDCERCYRDNVCGAELLARACARLATPLITFSSDLVFDGRSAVPYVEEDALAPLGTFGRTKQTAERRVLAACPTALVIRMGACFGPWDDDNFITAALCELAAGRDARVARDLVVSPAYLPDVVHACLDLAIDGERGCWHLAHASAITVLDAVRSAAPAARARVIGVDPGELGWCAPRPAYRALGTARGALLPQFDDALHRYHQTRSQG